MCFGDPFLKEHMESTSHENFANIHKFMEILSVCHTVIAEKSKHAHNPDHLAYNASSPDELALVNAAKFFGYYFKGRDEDNNMLVEVSNSKDDLQIGNPVKQFKLLNVIEFTSTRKRMTVIVKSLEDDSIRVMCKGADSIIIPRLKDSTGSLIKRTMKYLEEFSKEGLRTLLIAEKVIPQDFYNQWNKEYQLALISTNNREEKVN